MANGYDYDLNRDAIEIEEMRENFPGYDSIEDVEETDEPPSPEYFKREHRDKLQPLLVRGGIEHWPAIEKWQDLDYVSEKAGDVELTLLDYLFVDQMLKILDEWDVAEAIGFANDHRAFKMELDRYLDLLHTDFVKETTLYLENLPLPDSLEEDVGDIPFNDGEILWAGHFFGRRTYSDIHDHRGLDAFMCQVTGRKEVILFPPDDRNWRGLHCHEPKATLLAAFLNMCPVRLFDVDTERFPEFHKTTPIRVQVEAGDVLYIPNPWWHGVLARDDEVAWNTAMWMAPTHLSFDCPQTRWRHILGVHEFEDDRTGDRSEMLGHVPRPGWGEWLRKSVDGLKAR